MNQKMFTTEGTEYTEFEAVKRGEFMDVKDAHPGRNIGVIDLAPGGMDRLNLESGLLGRCRVLLRPRSWLRTCRIAILVK